MRLTVCQEVRGLPAQMIFRLFEEGEIEGVHKISTLTTLEVEPHKLGSSLPSGAILAHNVR